MAGMRPTALAKRIQDFRSNIPILFISGFVEDQIIRIRLLDEYTQFLPRPLKRDYLFGAVRQALKTPGSIACGPVECAAFAAALPGAAGA
jgi:two-component SAPR family response regulator